MGVSLSEDLDTILRTVSSRRILERNARKWGAHTEGGQVREASRSLRWGAAPLAEETHRFGADGLAGQ